MMIFFLADAGAIDVALYYLKLKLDTTKRGGGEA